MLMYCRKKVRYRRDGYCWKKRKDGKTTREDHMKLKVQGVEVSHVICNFSLSSPHVKEEKKGWRQIYVRLEGDACVCVITQE